MDISTLIMFAAAFLFLIAVYLKSPASATEGLQTAFYLFLEVVPRMAAALMIAGLIQVLVPQEVIARWMGKESGLQGLFVANALGALTPGGPMSQFPIIASLYKIGIGIGPLVAYMTAWSLMGFQRISYGSSPSWECALSQYGSLRLSYFRCWPAGWPKFSGHEWRCSLA